MPEIIRSANRNGSNGFRNGSSENGGYSRNLGLLITSGRHRNLGSAARLSKLGLSQDKFVFILGASSGAGLADQFASGNSDNFLRGWIQQAEAKHFRLFPLPALDNTSAAHVSYRLIVERRREVPSGIVEHAVYSPHEGKTIYVPITMENLVDATAASMAVPGYGEPISIRDIVEDGLDGGVNPAQNAEHFLSRLRKKRIKGIVLHNIPYLLDKDPDSASYLERVKFEEQSARLLLFLKSEYRHLLPLVSDVLINRPLNVRFAQAALQSAEDLEGIVLNLYPKNHMKINPNSPSTKEVIEQWMISTREARFDRQKLYNFLNSPFPSKQSEQISDVSRV